MPSSNDEEPRDLRYTESESNDIRISRELDGRGRLARGDHTHMHTLNFSARAVPREKVKLAPVHEPQVPAQVSFASPPPESVAAPVAKVVLAPDAGVLQRLAAWWLNRRK